MSKGLTPTQFQQAPPDAYSNIEAAIKEMHSQHLEQYLKTYGNEPPDKLVRLHFKFSENNGALVAIEPHGNLLHWNASSTQWIAKGNIYSN